MFTNLVEDQHNCDKVALLTPVLRGSSSGEQQWTKLASSTIDQRALIIEFQCKLHDYD